jgi:hypothetical protein
MRHRVHNTLPRWMRRAIYALTGALVLTGGGWLVVAYLLAPAGEPLPAPHPLAGSMLMLHGIAAYSALVAFALVGHVHLRTGWRIAPLRGGALRLCGAIAFLALTGLGFYYVAGESAIPWLRWSHVAGGVLLPVWLVRHIVRGRRALRRV